MKTGAFAVMGVEECWGRDRKRSSPFAFLVYWLLHLERSELWEPNVCPMEVASWWKAQAVHFMRKEQS